VFVRAASAGLDFVAVERRFCAVETERRVRVCACDGGAEKIRSAHRAAAMEAFTILSSRAA
jgi:hypothetical protein